MILLYNASERNYDGSRSTMTKKKINSRLARLESNLAKTILQYIQGRRYSPMTAQELMNGLSIPTTLHDTFLSALGSLVHENSLIVQNERYRFTEENSNLATGTISIHPMKGFGFVKNATGIGKDIFIPRHSIKDAVDGDTVEVEITEISAKGPEGKVVAILKRSRTHLGCTIVEKSNHRWSAYSPLLGDQKTVFVTASSKEKLKAGDRIICKVLDWNSTDDSVDAVLSRRIGNISDPSLDVIAAIEEFELPNGFRGSG